MANLQRFGAVIAYNECVEEHERGPDPDWMRTMERPLPSPESLARGTGIGVRPLTTDPERLKWAIRSVNPEAGQTPGVDSAARLHGKLRIDFLDGIRALCALVVVVGHATRESVGAPSLLVSLFEPSNLAVGVFIVISGFSLGLGAARGKPISYRTFMRRRAWRILPPYFAALCISALSIVALMHMKTGTHWDDVLPFSISGTMKDFFLVQDVVGGRSPNYVFWSIAIEWHLYFAFPLLWKLRTVKGRLLIIGIAAVATGALFGVWSGNPWYGFPPQFAFLFVVGLIAADIATSNDNTAKRIKSTLTPNRATLAFFMSVIPTLVLIKLYPDYFMATVLFGVCVAALIIALIGAAHDFYLRRVLEWPPLVAIGFFSYSLYLIHAPVLQFLDQFVVHPLHCGAAIEALLMTVVGSAISVLVAYGFHRVFERPFLQNRSFGALFGQKKGRHRLDRPRPSTSGTASTG